MISGFLNLDKPQGWTSHDCVAKVRRLLRQKKVGHGGTLDPAASGVLPIALGRATRLLQFLAANKAYRAVMRFGVTTTTDDLEGDVITTQAATTLTEAIAIAPLAQFVGTIDQVPPRYSAIQVEGRRLYDLARQGRTVTVPTRTVQVFAITPVQWQPGEFPELTVDITCGSGTYIRSIARDWGQVLGTGATLAGLERTASSGFTRATSMTLEALAATLEEGNFEPIAPAIVLQHLPSLVLPSDLAQRWQQGQKILYTPSDPALDADCWRVHAPDNQFLGITSWEHHDLDPSSNTIRLLPKVVFQD